MNSKKNSACANRGNYVDYPPRPASAKENPRDTDPDPGSDGMSRVSACPAADTRESWECHVPRHSAPTPRMLQHYFRPELAVLRPQLLPQAKEQAKENQNSSRENRRYQIFLFTFTFTQA